ncbi:hypothetical protein ABPG72_018837 [Tetrahymena utriculariae]
MHQSTKIWKKSLYLVQMLVVISQLVLVMTERENSVVFDLSKKSVITIITVLVKCNSSKYLDENCNTIQTFSNVRCFDDQSNIQNHPNYKTTMGVSLGSNSKCFNSSLINEKYKTISEEGLFYTYTCTAANQVIVKVRGNKVTCPKNGEQLRVPGQSGLLTFPEKLDNFCAFKKLCPSNCNFNDFCNNGACLCRKGFRGAACDQTA